MQARRLVSGKASWKHALRLAFILAAAGLAAGQGASAPQRAAMGVHEPARPQRDVPGVANFAKLSHALYRGAQPTARGFAELKKRGIRTVVNLRPLHSDRKGMAGLGLRYAHLSFKAWHAEDQDVAAFLKIVADPRNQPVFVHCQAGADRTGTMVVAYRVCIQGWSLQDAVKELPRFGFHEEWVNLRHYLKEFDPLRIERKMKTMRAPKVDVVR